MARRRARELAFQALFQAERGGSDLPEAWMELRGDLAAEEEDEDDGHGGGEGDDAEAGGRFIAAAGPQRPWHS